MKIPEITIQTGSSEDEKLYEIVNKIMEKDYHSLIKWIVKYRYQNFNSELEIQFEADFINIKASVSRFLKKYKKMLMWSKLDEACRAFETEIYTIIESFRKKYVFLEKAAPGLFTYLNEVTKRDDVSCENDLIKIKELLQKIEKETKSPDFSDCLQEQVEFEKKLTNHIFLLKELIEILTMEHDSRITDTRENFNAFIKSHQSQIEKIRTDMGLAEDQIHKLQNDTSIEEDDKKNLLIAFKKKYNELAKILKNENNRMITIKTLSDNILEGFIYLKDLIKSLGDQLVQYKKREEYIESLIRIGKDIPDFKNTLETLSSSFKGNFKHLKKSFLASDHGLQKKILDAIESQEVINRIVFSESDKTSEEINISLPGEDTDIEVINPGKIVTINLDKFKTIRKK